MIRKRCLALPCSLFALATLAGADLLGTASADIGCQRFGAATAITYAVRIGDVALFDLHLDAGTPGNNELIVIDRGEPFRQAVRKLTDGVSDNVFRVLAPAGLRPACTTGTAENVFFAFAFPCANGIDFAGTRIDRIEMTLQNVEIRTNAGTSSMRIDGKIRVYGECLSQPGPAPIPGGSASFRANARAAAWDPSCSGIDLAQSCLAPSQKAIAPRDRWPSPSGSPRSRSAMTSLDS